MPLPSVLCLGDQNQSQNEDNAHLDHPAACVVCLRGPEQEQNKKGRNQEQTTEPRDQDLEETSPPELDLKETTSESVQDLQQTTNATDMDTMPPTPVVSPPRQEFSVELVLLSPAPAPRIKARNVQELVGGNSSADTILNDMYYVQHIIRWHSF